jgi:tRNA(Ile)-lysidine synthase
MVPPADQPIGPAERNSLFSNIRLPVAVAVSGGADSMALMHLVAAWAKTEEARAAGQSIGRSPVLVVTVDHGLRPNSADEARWVGEEARRLGLDHVVLPWTDVKPRSGIQEAARNARYALMTAYMGSERLPRTREVLLAHHLDDQAETLLMRLARGSGIDGLAAMAEVETRIWLRLAHPVEERLVAYRRPLLAIPRSRLAATLASLGGRHLEDPSNKDTRFERVRLRKASAQREALGLSNAMLALAARRLRSARTALAAAHHELALSCLDLHDGAWASADASQLMRAPGEVTLRVLRSVICAFGGQSEPPARPQLEEIADMLAEPGAPARTLGGTLIARLRQMPAAGSAGGDVFMFHREPGRRPLPRVELQPGEGLFWDRRFYISLDPGASSSVRVQALGTATFAHLKRQFSSIRMAQIPTRAAAALPSIWCGDDLLAVPHLRRIEPTLGGPCIESRPMLAIEFAAQHVRSIFGSVPARPCG